MKHQIQERYITEQERDSVVATSVESHNQLSLYIELLLWWNKKTNLVSRDVSHETLKEHVLHSLMVSLMPEYKGAKRIVDAGSGGGLPGLPLGLIDVSKEIIINDKIEKKLFVVRDMINKLGLAQQVSTVPGSIEHVQFAAGDCVISKHAFKIDELYQFIKLGSWNSMVMLKGYGEGLEELERINEAFNVSIIRLDAPFMSDFYEGKAIYQLTKQV